MIATINQWAYVENNLRWEKNQKVHRVRLLNKRIFSFYLTAELLNILLKLFFLPALCLVISLW